MISTTENYCQLYKWKEWAAISYMANKKCSPCGVDGVKKTSKNVAMNVNIIISSHEKTEFISVVILHVTEQVVGFRSDSVFSSYSVGASISARFGI
jgi:hypothetical protein